MPQLTEVLCHFPWRQWRGEQFNRQWSRAVLQGKAMIRDARSFAATATQLVHRINVLYLPPTKIEASIIPFAGSHGVPFLVHRKYKFVKHISNTKSSLISRLKLNNENKCLIVDLLLQSAHCSYC